MQAVGTNIEGHFLTSRACSGGRDLGVVSVRIEEGKISQIEPGKKAGALVLDESLWLAPGLVDLQVNGGYGIDLLTAPDRLEELSKHLVFTGVLSYLAALPSPSASDAIELAREVICTNSQDGLQKSPAAPKAEVLGMHLEGPVLNPTRRGVHPPERLLSGRDALRFFEEVISVVDPNGRPAVRALTLAPEIDGAKELVPLAKRHQVIIAAGHTDASYEEGTEAIALGIRVFTHVFNAVRPIHHRDPGILTAYLLDTSTILTLICDGVHVSEQIVRLLTKIVGPARIALVSDAVAGLGDTSAGEKSLLISRAATDSTGRLLGGTTPLSLCAAQFARFAQISFPAALHCASGIPARILKLRDRGVLKVGAPAQLIAVSEEGEVSAVIQGNNLFQLSSGDAANRRST